MVEIAELRRLIVDAAPDPVQAEPALTCAEDALLDGVIPFSSVIVLGVIVAVEDRYGIRVTKQMLQGALDGGATLRKLASMIEGVAP
jgi:acyl carrier protein